MSNIFLVPTWFFGFDIVLEVLFAVVTLWVSYLAHTLYTLTDRRQFKLFSLGFVFIGISYVIQSVFNALIVFKLNQEICNTVKYLTLNLLNNLAFSLFMVSFIIGLITLTYTLLKTKNTSVFVLISLITLAGLFFSYNFYSMSYILSCLLLGFIVYLYFQEYLRLRNNSVLFVLIAFISLFLSKILFLLSLSHGVAYVIGHFLEFTAYIFIFINLYLALKK